MPAQPVVAHVVKAFSPALRSPRIARRKVAEPVAVIACTPDPPSFTRLLTALYGGDVPRKPPQPVKVFRTVALREVPEETATEVNVVPVVYSADGRITAGPSGN